MEPDGTTGLLSCYAALLAEDGGVEGVVKGKAVGLCLQIGLQLGQLGFVLFRLLLAVELGKALLRGLELGIHVV